jgi:hypothetical protein
MNNYGVNTKSMFDGQVLICGAKALVLVFLGARFVFEKQGKKFERALLLALNTGLLGV